MSDTGPTKTQRGGSVTHSAAEEDVGNVVRVSITFEKGVTRTLTDDDAKEWGNLVIAQGVYCHMHGLPCPDFPWVEEKVN